MNFTGCYVTTAPSNSYFKIKIAITDSSGMTTISTSVPNNMGTFNILAGNTEPGIGGSASSAVFDIDSASTITNLPGSLVVTDSGIFYLRDKTYGILKIDPASGVVSQIVPQTGNMVNGPIGTATLRDPGAFINLDYDGNLLIFDVDRIRKVDFATNSVYTLIGGGTTRAHNTLANNFKFNSCRTAKYCPVMVLPNGHIYFTDFPDTVGTKSIWKYDPETNLVTETQAKGTGILARPAEDDIGSTDYRMTSVSFAFDVTTSEITTALVQVRPVVCPSCGHNGHLAFLDMKTGNTIPSPLPAAVTAGTSTFKSTPTARDGKLYLLGQEQRYQLSRFNEETNTWTTILGTGTSGSCEDGTDALQCDMFAMDAFITSDGRVFFISNGMIRTIDSDNKVKTLFGQRKNFGDGAIATSARINLAPFFDIFPNGDLAFYDSEESVIRKFTPGGMMTKLVGNGTLTTTSGKLGTETGVNAKWWGGKLQMAIDPLTDNLYFQSLNRLYVLRSSDQMVQQVTGTATRYHSADGLPASQIIVTVNEQASLLGIQDGKILMAMSERNASSQNHRCHLKTFDSKNNYVQEHVAGNDNVCMTSSFPDDGVQTSVANVGGTANQIQFGAGWFNNSWVLPRYNQSRLLKAYTPGGTISTVATLPRMFESFTFFGDYVYYCATGKVYKYHIADKVETALPWPGDSYKCSGFSIKYSADRSSIIFPFSQNGMTGFAEIVEEI